MTGAVLCDLSGVLYVGDQAVPGAAEALTRLRDSGVEVRFITNVSRRPADAILDDLRRLGFDLPARDLFTAPMAARQWLRERGLNPMLLVHPALEREFDGPGTGPPEAVLVGDAGEYFTYERLNRAFRVLLEGAPLLALGDNRYFRGGDGMNLDVGPFVAALEYAAKTRAVVLGKPAPEFFHAALATLRCEPAEVVMIGDDVQADVDGALAAGLQAILVRTGKYRAGDERCVRHGEARVAADFGAAVESILAAR